MNDSIDKIAKKFQTYLNEVVSNKKRYVVTMEFYIWAKNDADAKKLAEQYAKTMNAREDNSASITSLYEQETGTLGNSKVFDKSK